MHKAHRHATMGLGLDGDEPRGLVEWSRGESNPRAVIVECVLLRV